jgi:hypothetical protein
VYQRLKTLLWRAEKELISIIEYKGSGLLWQECGRAMGIEEHYTSVTRYMVEFEGQNKRRKVGKLEKNRCKVFQSLFERIQSRLVNFESRKAKVQGANCGLAWGSKRIKRVRRCIAV